MSYDTNKLADSIKMINDGVDSLSKRMDAMTERSPKAKYAYYHKVGNVFELVEDNKKVGTAKTEAEAKEWLHRGWTPR